MDETHKVEELSSRAIVMAVNDKASPDEGDTTIQDVPKDDSCRLMFSNLEAPDACYGWVDASESLAT
ncbi:hypothetical protein MUK42_02743 [Musa troglodytarum]|uniref:Uncharacterized protein n=1 Tax=Musa troglodytarum TaxID=320322 RepID=A0A9E7G2X3_9LILI|nr:hypothetical protein MUK42_02743 [Musa troglodytarum]